MQTFTVSGVVYNLNFFQSLITNDDLILPYFWKLPHLDPTCIFALWHNALDCKPNTSLFIMDSVGSLIQVGLDQWKNVIYLSIGNKLCYISHCNNAPKASCHTCHSQNPLRPCFLVPSNCSKFNGTNAFHARSQLVCTVKSQFIVPQLNCERG